MKFKDFKKMMKKAVFTWEEAKIVAFETPSATLKLQLHQWKKVGDINHLKKGVYIFSDESVDKIEIAKQLYSPCYLSLEYVLNYYGLLPDVVFAMTLVTTKATRKFNTPLGEFSYQKIKKEAFRGYDPKTLMAECEKALADYLYLNRNNFLVQDNFWKELRIQNLETLKFKKVFSYAKYFRSKKLNNLLESLRSYAKLS